MKEYILLACLLSLFILGLFLEAILPIPEKPCEEFANRATKNLPARCISYYQNL
jgi:hypothetical protein